MKITRFYDKKRKCEVNPINIYNMGCTKQNGNIDFVFYEHETLGRIFTRNFDIEFEQEGKKPIVEEVEKETNYKCPTCDEYVGDYFWGCYFRHKHCSNCGTKILWEDE